VFAFDPSLALRLHTAAIQEITIRVPWECDADTGRLEPGPAGEYIEVVDVDPASGVAYLPVDLDHPSLLAQDGLRPSEGNPQFHQQMVYAVAMATIGHFERALGRVALWAPRRIRPEESATVRWQSQFVRRLRIYPHALREQNAYYSPHKKALLFGYFPVRTKDAYNTPGTTVFTCLSHDIIAHEVTHALLDGIHPRFNEPSNPDVHAFHEAFADIIALFQHFSYASVLRDQICRTRGDLESENLLGQLAQQFGRATGRGSALRDALGSQANGVWKRRRPNPRALENITLPHDRGAILVAGVFGAFLLLYRARTVDLIRLATEGTGKLPDGEINPDLANRLAEEAARTASAILQMCIRALDYCPPVNITFGDYLRAIITADANFNPDDDFPRVAVVESFREWGIYPRGIRSMSVEALMWPSGAEVFADTPAQGTDERRNRGPASPEELEGASRAIELDIMDLFSQAQLGAATKIDEVDSSAEALPGEDPDEPDPSLAHEPLQLTKWDLDSDRFEVWKNMERNRLAVWRWLVRGKGRKYAPTFGLLLDNPDFSNPKQTIYRNEWGDPSVEVHSVRSALRRDSRGAVLSDLIVEITQRRRGFLSADEQRNADKGPPIDVEQSADFKFRAGCTLVIDTTKNVFRHIIRTAGRIDDDDELAHVRRFLTGEADPTTNAFDGVRAVKSNEPKSRGLDEPFALLHRHQER
jgi:hypothetical protein